MAVTVVTDTDVAAVPYHPKKGYSFRLDSENTGPFAGMLPLSQVLDPAQEEDAIKRLTGQFSAIPYERMRDFMLTDQSSYYVRNAANKAGEEAARKAGLERLIEEYINNPEKMKTSANPVLGRFADRFGDMSRSHGASTDGNARDFIGSYAAHNKLDESKATDAIRRNLINSGREEMTYLNNELSSPSLEPVIVAARKAKLTKILADVHPEAHAETISAAEIINADEFRAQISKALDHRIPSLTTAQRETLLSNIALADDEHNITAGGKSLLSELNKSLNKEGISYTLPEVLRARECVHEPEKMAAHHLTGMRALAIERSIVPSNLAGQYTEAVSSGLDSCPKHIADCANASHMKIVLAGRGVNLDSIMPYSPAGYFENSAGGATGHGIYAYADKLGEPAVLKPAVLKPAVLKPAVLKPAVLKPAVLKPAVLKEEIMHEVERRIVNGEQFSLQDPWKKAISLDTASGGNNPVYQILAGKDITFAPSKKVESGRIDGNAKSNAAIGPRVKALTPNQLDDVPFMEAVPDVYHYKARAEQMLLEGKGKVRVGGTMGVFGGTVYKTPEEIMQAAFPNSWQMLEGPQAGMKLIQHTDGTVTQIAAKIAAPQQTTEVTSLAEHCTNAITHGKAQGVESFVSGAEHTLGATESWLARMGLSSAKTGLFTAKSLQTAETIAFRL